MHQDTVEKIEHALEGWSLLDSLPRECYGFHYRALCVPIDDRYDIFSYENAVIHKSVTAYYHEETHEYKLRMQVGFVEFCRIEYITNSLEIFGEKLSKELMQLLEDMVTFNPKNISSLVIKKGICDWAFAKELPETLEGYQLFIKPQQPVKINNGSYIIIDYVDFTHASDVTIYYNMYRDEFFGEARIHSIPDVTYDFDSNELVELQEKLEKHLVPRMREARQAADAAAHEGEA
ncbi:MAG: hypothetical protein SPL71_12350 [Oribacterium sp.]|nr:hypothetical protein [Oribacterium sp.]